VYKAYPTHSTGHYRVGNCASQDFVESLLVSLWVSIRRHDEACLAVVVLDLVENSVEVWKLPREDVACQKKCCRVQDHTCLRKSANDRRQRTDDSTDKSVVLTSLFHW
jgi:hypothetical protein